MELCLGRISPLSSSRRSVDFLFLHLSLSLFLSSHETLFARCVCVCVLVFVCMSLLCVCVCVCVCACTCVCVCPSVSLSDCQLCERQGSGRLHPAGVTSHPGEHGPEQHQPLPAGQTGSHHGETHRTPPGVCSQSQFGCL